MSRICHFVSKSKSSLNLGISSELDDISFPEQRWRSGKKSPFPVCSSALLSELFFVQVYREILPVLPVERRCAGRQAAQVSRSKAST